MEYNIYCDESCHLEHDGNDIFVLGGIMCPHSTAHEMNARILAIKKRFNFNPKSEIKWSKISPGNEAFYLALVDLFFEIPELKFRGYVGTGKTNLNHKIHHQSYDDWYYKMYYRMLEFLLNKNGCDDFYLFLDIKDTLGSKKIKKLQKYFNLHYNREIVKRVQLVQIGRAHV